VKLLQIRYFDKLNCFRDIWTCSVLLCLSSEFVYKNRKRIAVCAFPFPGINLNSDPCVKDVTDAFSSEPPNDEQKVCPRLNEGAFDERLNATHSLSRLSDTKQYITDASYCSTGSIIQIRSGQGNVTTDNLD